MSAPFEASDELVCHRCEGSLLLATRVPYAMERPDGHVVNGTRGIALCPSCDHTDPIAQGVLAYFTYHNRVADEVEAVALIEEWARRAAQRLQRNAQHREADPSDFLDRS